MDCVINELVYVASLVFKGQAQLKLGKWENIWRSSGAGKALPRDDD